MQLWWHKCFLVFLKVLAGSDELEHFEKVDKRVILKTGEMMMAFSVIDAAFRKKSEIE